MSFKNWAGNYTYRAERIHHPETVEQVQDLVRQANKVKALGSRHSFNEVADSEQDLISTERLDRILSLDTQAMTVTMEGGVRYGELGRYLEERGFALHNLASLPHISVVGACATGTHGSGNGSGNLSTQVRGIRLVQSNGEIVALSQESDPDRFSGAVVGLGALGIITEVTLAIEPTFAVEQQVFEWLPLESVEQHFEEIEASGYSVSLFTDWQTSRFNQVWVKRRVGPGGNPSLPNPFFGAVAATRGRHPIGDLSAIHCTEQMGVAGPWHERLPHFRLDFTPSSGEELQTEYFVPRERIVDALRTVASLAPQIAPLLQVTEVRTISSDELWLSPAYHRDSVAIHFTWKQDWDSVRRLLPVIEAKLAPFEARPHWGKLFTIRGGRLGELYDRMPDFRRLASEFDPTGKFRNPFLDETVFIDEK